MVYYAALFKKIESHQVLQMEHKKARAGVFLVTVVLAGSLETTLNLEYHKALDTAWLSADEEQTLFLLACTVRWSISESFKRNPVALDFNLADAQVINEKFCDRRTTHDATQFVADAGNCVAQIYSHTQTHT